jgi:hypothetical protein
MNGVMSPMATSELTAHRMAGDLRVFFGANNGSIAA